ncbi:hypothetical protein Glove_437g25 [Diversispora epigaea]|uniref:Uncharacterized protein n=1 Tax=Diversispora epigaea TaxID=1348612 RepID=A0A397H0B6_9GLOM|nr:hypothetical protein Glove_437g25 [Diversispora epigaea]
MEDAQYTIDSLRELNIKLVSDIAELRKENAEIPELRKKFAKVEAENIKLKQDKEEIEIRFVKLEQTAKENAENAKQSQTENTELRDRVTKLEQKQSLTCPELSLKAENRSNGEKVITPNPMPELVQSSTEPEPPATYLPQDVIDDDSAETLDFVETVYKEQVSKEIIERIREKKFRDQEVLSTPQDTCSVIISEQINNQSKSQNASSGLQSNQSNISEIKLHRPKSKLSTNQVQAQSVISPELSVISPQIKIPYNQKVEQGLIHELFEFIRGTDFMSLQNLKKTPLNSISIKQISDISVDIDLTPGSVPHLAYLFGKAEKTG